MEQHAGQASIRRMKIGHAAVVVAAAGVVSASVLAAIPAGAASAPSAKLTVVKSSSAGKVLTDGKTVYTLKPSSTPCSTACYVVWPPVILPHGVRHAKAGTGVTASKLGTKSVPGVGLQVTYGGKLLYFFTGDSGPGQVKGDITDTWGTWSAVVLSKSGAVASPPTTSAGSGGVSF